MSRIRRGYEAHFHALLGQLRARRPRQGAQWLLASAEQLCRRELIPLADALTQVHAGLCRKILCHRARLASASACDAGAPSRNSNGPPPLLLCDAGLGGLARWLRAAGQEALWKPDVDDDVLLKQARELGATLLTTDSMLMERRLLRDRIIPSVWLPPTLTMFEQLALVFQELDLTAREPRCMSCGGELQREEKETLRERIPPKTWHWVDDYFLCARCDKLFWHGTHWQRIQARLRQLEVGPPPV